MTFPDGTEAVADATFRVQHGEFVAVVGPSGCGKSTLLRIASGLLEATGGSTGIESIEHRSTRASERQEAAGVAGERNDRLRVPGPDADAVAHRPRQRRVTRRAGRLRRGRNARRLGQQAIELVGLTGFEHHYPKSLSGGMRMRCSLARTLTLQPPIMLFDEPFGAVDEITRERLNEETLRLFEDQRFAGLFITHSISEAVFLSTRVLVMSPRPGSHHRRDGDSVLVPAAILTCASTPGSRRSAPRCPTPCGPADNEPA